MRRSEALLRMRPVPVPPGLSASLCILLKSPVGCLSSRRATCGQDACLQEQRLLSFCPQARLGHHGAPLLSVLFLPDVLPHRLIKRADSQQLVRICASGRWPGARLDRTTKASRKSDSSGGTFTEHCESSWTPPQCCFLPPAIGRFFLRGSGRRKRLTQRTVSLSQTLVHRRTAWHCTQLLRCDPFVSAGCKRLSPSMQHKLVARSAFAPQLPEQKYLYSPSTMPQQSGAVIVVLGA